MSSPFSETTSPSPQRGQVFQLATILAARLGLPAPTEADYGRWEPLLFSACLELLDRTEVLVRANQSLIRAMAARDIVEETRDGLSQAEHQAVLRTAVQDIDHKYPYAPAQLSSDHLSLKDVQGG